MPYIPTRYSDQKTVKIAKNLLEVLVQLTKPENGLVISLTSGQILVGNEQAKNYGPAGSEQMDKFLSMDTAAFGNLVNDLRISKQVSGNFVARLDHTSDVNHYSMKLLQYQDEEFVCTELSSVGQPTTLIPFEGDSYHNVFENSVEPLFILDCQGNFIDLNQSALKLINKDKDKLVGSSIFRDFGLNLFERV